MILFASSRAALDYDKSFHFITQTIHEIHLLLLGF